MSWQKSDSIGAANMRRKGFDSILLAGQVCLIAESLAPVPLVVQSFKDGVLKISVSKATTVAFTLVEGSYLAAIQAKVISRKLPPVTKITLTVAPD